MPKCGFLLQRSLVPLCVSCRVVACPAPLQIFSYQDRDSSTGGLFRRQELLQICRSKQDPVEYFQLCLGNVISTFSFVTQGERAALCLSRPNQNHRGGCSYVMWGAQLLAKGPSPRHAACPAPPSLLRLSCSACQGSLIDLSEFSLSCLLSPLLGPNLQGKS